VSCERASEQLNEKKVPISKLCIGDLSFCVALILAFRFTSAFSPFPLRPYCCLVVIVSPFSRRRLGRSLNAVDWASGWVSAVAGLSTAGYADSPHS